MKKTLIKLIARFVGNKCVTFDGSRVYYWNVPMIVLPMSGLVHLQQGLENAFGQDTRKIFYHLGKIQGKNGTNILLEKYKVKLDKNDPSFFIEQTEFLGIGKMHAKRLDFDSLDFSFSNKISPNAYAYLSKFPIRKKPICDYVRGLIAGGIEAVTRNVNSTDVSMDAVETKCITRGDDECVFEIRESSHWTDKEEREEFDISLPELDLVREKETLNTLLRLPDKSIKIPETQLSSYLKKKIGPRPFKFENNGEVSLIGQHCIITPMDIFMLLYYVCRSHFGTSVDQIFSGSGRTLGREFSTTLFQELNFDKKNRVHQDFAFEQIGLFGFGKPEFAKKDINNSKYIIRVYNSPGNNYLALLGPGKIPVDFFLSGIIEGITEYTHGHPITFREEKCVVSGNQFCIFSS